MKQQGNIIIILIIVAALIICITLYNQSKSISKTPQPTPSTNSQQTKTFRSSSVMKFSIEIPENYQVEEKFTNVTIATPKGSIYINRTGTNFEKVEDYINDLGTKNHFTLTDKKILQINGLKTISGIIEKEKIYFIYNDYAVYTLTAKSESLYSDLDQIAQSFRYIP